MLVKHELTIKSEGAKGVAKGAKRGRWGAKGVQKGAEGCKTKPLGRKEGVPWGNWWATLHI